MGKFKTRLTVAVVSSLLFNGFVVWGIVRSNMDGFTAMLLAVLFVRAELQDWTERLNRWAKEETFAAIQATFQKLGAQPIMNPKHDTGLKFEAEPPQSQR